MKRSRRFLLSFLIIPIAFLLALIVAEYVVGACNLDWKTIEKLLYYQTADIPIHEVSDDPDLMFRLKSGASNADGRININALGYRGISHPAEKPQGVYRIVCLGGSNFYGLKLFDNESFPAQLEKMLNRRFKGRFEVWNAGTCAYVGTQMSIIGQEALKKYDPDLFILGLSNIGAPAFLNESPISDYFTTHPELFEKLFHDSFLGFSPSQQARIAFSSRLGRYFVAGFYAMRESGWMSCPHFEKNNVRAIRKLIGDASAQGVKSCIFIYPGASTEDYRSYYSETNVPILRPDAEGLPREFTPIHPPAYVMTWYAEDVVKMMLANGLIESDSKAIHHKPAPNMPLPELAHSPIDSMADIPGGDFIMGCSPGDNDCHADEKPLHNVTLSPFRMDKTEITNGQYKKCVEDGACSEPEWSEWYREKPVDHPIVGVTLHQSAQYCKFHGKSLPTEAQWEYAARSGVQENLYAPLEEIAWYAGNSQRSTHPVAQKRPNAWGLFDMIGNAWEWCLDWYSFTYYYENSPKMNPPGPSQGIKRILRGGGWFSHPWQLRVSYRNTRFEPTYWNKDFGFRCVENSPHARQH